MNGDVIIAFHTKNWLKGDGEVQRKFEPEPVNFRSHLVTEAEKALSPEGTMIRLISTRDSDGDFQVIMLNAAEMNELALAVAMTLTETQKIHFIHKMTTK